MKSLRWLVLGALLAATACGDYSNELLKEDLEYLYAVPARAALEVRVAELQARNIELAHESSGLEQRTDAVLGETASWYIVSLLVSLDVNLNVLGFLDLVDTITGFPPTARNSGSRQWGPWPSEESPHTDFRFIMSRDRTLGQFDFSLQTTAAAARNTPAYDEGWAGCLYGNVVPTDGSVRRGTGNLTADAATCDRFEASGASGQASIGFDTAPDEQNPQGKTSLQIHFENFLTRGMIDKDPNSRPMQADYQYLERGDLSGSFDFDTWGDLDNGENPNQLAQEHIVIKTRWDHTGAGRADSTISGGDLGALVIELHECWNPEKKRVYYQDSHNLAPTEGLPSDCALPESE